MKNDSASALSSSEVSSLKKQLRSIRDQVNKLLDTIDSTDNKHGGTSHGKLCFYFIFIFKPDENIVWYVNISIIIYIWNEITFIIRNY